MKRLKIVTNPYKQITEFYSYSNANGWVKIDRNHYPRTKLLNENICKGYFSYVVEEIMDILYEEYGEGSDGLEIIFEGTSDDFQTLEEVCHKNQYDCEITLINDDQSFMDVEETVLTVNRSYNDIRQIIDSMEIEDNKINDSLNKLSVIMDNIVPLFIIGNDDVSKSNFINALIGEEIISLSSNDNFIITSSNNYIDSNDIIKIVMPLENNILNQSNTPFVIIGISKSSEIDLNQVIHENAKGLLIYVSDENQLDNFNNRNLYNQLRNMNIIDERFTMLVVNTNDSYNDDDIDLNNKLIPMNLNSQRIFMSNNLDAIENEILTYLNTYSKYYQCQKAIAYLNPIQESLCIEIDKSIQNEEKKKQDSTDSLDTSKVYLLRFLDDMSHQFKDFFNCNHKQCINNYVKHNTPYFTSNRIKKYEKEIRHNQEYLYNYSKQETAVQKSMNSVTRDLNHNFNRVLDKRNLKAVKKTGTTLVKDIKKTYTSMEERNETKQRIDKKVNDVLFDKLISEFISELGKAGNGITKCSQRFCNNAIINYQQELINIVNTAGLTDDKKREIVDMIHYQDDELKFEIPLLHIEDFKQQIKIRDFVLIDNDKLDIGKLVKEFNKMYKRNIEKMSYTTIKTHRKKYLQWQYALLSKVQENIVDYYPELMKIQKEIEEATMKIDELENYKENLENNINHINELIN